MESEVLMVEDMMISDEMLNTPVENPDAFISDGSLEYNDSFDGGISEPGGFKFSNNVILGIVIGVCAVVGIVLGIIFGRRAARK